MWDAGRGSRSAAITSCRRKQAHLHRPAWRNTSGPSHTGDPPPTERARCRDASRVRNHARSCTCRVLSGAGCRPLPVYICFLSPLVNRRPWATSPSPPTPLFHPFVRSVIRGAGGPWCCTNTPAGSQCPQKSKTPCRAPPWRMGRGVFLAEAGMIPGPSRRHSRPWFLAQARDFPRSFADPQGWVPTVDELELWVASGLDDVLVPRNSTTARGGAGRRPVSKKSTFFFRGGAPPDRSAQTTARTRSVAPP